jgi:CheY-specific phosphatase CheX
MPEPEFQHALHDSVEEVLEKMFFVQPLENPGPVAAPSAVIAVKLPFEGTPSGALILTISAISAQEIAADFLGADPADLAAHKVTEVVCELTNMICGSVLSRVESEGTFSLGSPHLLVADAWRLDSAAPKWNAKYTVQLAKGSLTAVMETR